MAFTYSDIGDLSYVKKITLDVSGGVSNRVIEAKQGDVNSRYLQITLIQNDKPLIIPENTTVRIGGTKPDGHCFLNDGDIHDNEVYVELTDQMLAVGGREKCDISLYNGTSRLSSVTFFVDITVEPYDEGKIESTDEYSSLVNALLSLQQSSDVANAAALAATLAEEMAEQVVDEASNINIIADKVGHVLNITIVGRNNVSKQIQISDGERGYSGLIPEQTIPYAPTVTIQANTMTDIGVLTGDIVITLGDPVLGYDNEWDFTIAQGNTAYQVTMSTVHWGLGIAPTFSANSTTLCRLYYIGETLCGEWSCV